MPVLIPKRRVSDAENKLRLLFCLKCVGMATQEQLWPFVARLELMEYMPYCLLLDELRRDGAVAVGRHALSGVMYLTPQGESMLTLLHDKLLPRDRERIQAAAPAYAATLNERRVARAVYERAGEGLFGAALSVREDDVPTLHLRMVTPREALCRAAVSGFVTSAPGLMQLLYTLPFAPGAEALPVLSGAEEAMARAMDGQAALCAYGGREHSAAVPLMDGDTRYAALLLLPDRASADGWAQVALQESEALGARVTALLEAQP